VFKEADAWTRLGMHPHIAYCYFVQTIEDIPYIFVEYADGGNLQEWIEAGRLNDDKKNLDLSIQFCHGMERAHERGMIHRDIKPANILMTQSGELKITDFGLVGYNTLQGGVQHLGMGHGKTQMGIRGMGTPAYMPPEQILDFRQKSDEVPNGLWYDSDIFSFGVCMWEMFCGDRPYRGDEEFFRNGPPDPSRYRKTTSPGLKEILLKSVAIDRKERYPDFKTLREALNAEHRLLFNEDAPSYAIKIPDTAADELNNQGYSFYQIGAVDDAAKCFEEALKKEASHPQAAFNFWVCGKMPGGEILPRLENMKSNPSVNKELVDGLKKQIECECIRTLEGHIQGVMSVSMTPNARFVVSGSYDKTLRLWDLETGACLKTMKGHSAAASFVSITPDANFAFSRSDDGTFGLWDLRTGTCKKNIKGHNSNSLSLSITPDSRCAISGRLDNTVCLWDVETGECIKTLEGHTGDIFSVSMTPDARFVVSGSADKTVRFWNLETGKCIKILAGHVSHVLSVSVTPDAKFAVSGSKDETVRFWDLEKGICLKTLKGHTQVVMSVSMTPDARFAVSGGLDKTLRHWDLNVGKCIKTLEGHTGNVMSVAITPDARFAVSGSWDSTIRIWDLVAIQKREIVLSPLKSYKERKETHNRKKDAFLRVQNALINRNEREAYNELMAVWNKDNYSNDSSINIYYRLLLSIGEKKSLLCGFQIKALHVPDIRSVSMSPDAKCAVSSGRYDNLVPLWNLQTGGCIKTLKGHNDTVKSVSISADPRFAISASFDGTLRLWDLETGRCVKSLEGHTGYVFSVSMTPDAKFAVSGGITVRLWDLETGQCIKIFEGHTDSVESVSMTPDVKFAVSGSKDKTLRLWDLETGQCIKIFEGHTGSVESVSMTPDAKFAVSGSMDDTIKLWDLENGICLRTLKGHTLHVRAVSMTPDAKFAVSGGGDGTLKIWDLEAGRCILTMGGHSMSVNAISMTPDARFVVSGSADETLRLWSLVWELEFKEKNFNMQNLDHELIFRICDDPRYDQEMFMRNLKPMNQLLESVRRKGLVENMNKAYKWNFPSDYPPLPAHCFLDIMCEVLEKPGYTLKKFMDAIADGRRL
jgi:WD40 repeat protein